MLPFERLRAIARSVEDGATLAIDAAECLAYFEDDPAGLVVACRRLLAHHPTIGPLWWLSARVLAAAEPAEAAWEAQETLRNDETPAVLSRALRGVPGVEVGVVEDRDLFRIARAALGTDATVRLVHGPVLEGVGGGPVLIRAEALSPSEALLTPHAADVVDACRDTPRAIWLVGGVGCLLPPKVYDALLAHLPGAQSQTTSPVLARDLMAFDGVVLPGGFVPPATVGRYLDCPVAPELLRRI